MPVQTNDMSVLQAAFQQFNTTSSELEKNYTLLNQEVKKLRAQLSESRQETEILREEAERNHRLSAVGEMATRMAHELRNPLGSIELFAGLIEKEFRSLRLGSEKLAWSAHLQTAVKSMDHLISNLLRFTGTPQPCLEEVQLHQLLRSLVPFVAPVMKQDHISLQEDYATEDLKITCDPDLLRQVFINLILNGVEAMSPGGTLTLSTRATHSLKPGVCVSISDTGVGLSAQVLTKLFDPFFTTKKQGTGLGLAIAQNSVKAHGGRLRVTNRSSGGACFTVDLPRQRKETPCSD